MKLLACVLAKNDEFVIGKCLARLSESADGIIVFDDGSIDKTVEISKSFEKVIKIFENPKYKEWKPVKNIKVILNYINSLKPEWILITDSDDVLDKRFAEKKEELLNNENAGRYHFREITLWGSKNFYRTDKPEWYSRTKDRTPYLMRWSPEFTYVERYKPFPMNNLRWLRKQWIIGIMKRFLPYKTFSKRRNKVEKILFEILWPSDYMDYTNIFFTGYKGKEIEIPLVRLHYHFADMNYAWRKHLTYALLSATIQHRTPGEIPDIVNWAANKLDEKGIKLEKVDPEWGVL
jgi:glycosyltransferase involved in cell wall biosynthesis